MDYETLKAHAKRIRRNVTELLALSPKNDPFYVGTGTDVAMAEWFADIWRRTGYARKHLRRVHYWITASREPVLMHNGKPYENTQQCWDYLNVASKNARYLELVNMGDIVDQKNPDPIIHAQYGTSDLHYEIDIPELDDPSIWTYGFSDSITQPYHMEIWIEKSTMNDVLVPVCERYSVNLCTFTGEVTTTACHSLIQRIHSSGNKPTRIFYISDFDPAGNSMPVAMARKVEWMVMRGNTELDVKVTVLALTAEQVETYTLPRIPLKDSDKRTKTYEERFGEGGVELDALEALYPGTLSDIVESFILRYYSEDARDEAREAERSLQLAIREQVDVITSRYQDEIAAIEAMNEELRSVYVDAGFYRVYRHQPDAEEDDDCLFDSHREYLEQLGYYKNHKRIASRRIRPFEEPPAREIEALDIDWLLGLVP